MPEYLQNPELLKEVVQCKMNSKLSTRAIELFQMLANEINKRLRYRDPMNREDCIGQAMEDLLKYGDRFDPLKSANAFAYYSQIAKNGFANGWNKLHPDDAGTQVALSNIDYLF